MGFLIVFLLCLVYIAIIVYPMIGIILIVEAISMYLQKGHPSAYYRDLEKFAMMCLGFILGMGLFIGFSNNVTFWNFYGILYIPYLLLVPIFIGRFQRRIHHKEYFDPIEKLIF